MCVELYTQDCDSACLHDQQTCSIFQLKRYISMTVALVDKCNMQHSKHFIASEAIDVQ